MIELHKFCSIVDKLVPSYPGKRAFLIDNPVESAPMEPNPDQVIYYASQYLFLLNMCDDKVSVKLILQAIFHLKQNSIDCYTVNSCRPPA